MRTGVDIKIGVTDSGREIEALVNEALKNPTGTLVLVDEKGRRVMVPSARISYIEIAPADVRRVGFSTTG